MVDKKEDPNKNREGYEYVDDKWTKVINGDRSGWWRYYSHYDKHGYCDNPARGY